MTGLCADGSATQTPGNPEMTDWEGSLAVICDKVTERRLLYLETWEQFVFMLMVTLLTLIWCRGFSLPHQYTLPAYGGRHHSSSKLKNCCRVSIWCLLCINQYKYCFLFFFFPQKRNIFYGTAASLTSLCVTFFCFVSFCSIKLLQSLPSAPKQAYSRTCYKDGRFVWLLPIKPPQTLLACNFSPPAKPLSLKASRLWYFLHINMSPSSATAGCQLNATLGLRKHRLGPLTDRLSPLTQKV